MGNRAVIYARYSSDMQDKSSIDIQVRNGTKHAQNNNLEIIDIYSDEAISGTTTNRPAYKKMFEDADKRKFDVIIIDDLSRFGRSVENNAKGLNILACSGVRVLCVQDNYDSFASDPSKKMLLQFKSVIDEAYIDNLAYKTRNGLEDKFLNGFATGGRIYGYKTEPVGGYTKKGNPEAYKYVINETEAEIVKRIFNLYINGYSSRQIAKLLNEEGIPSPTGKKWNGSTIQPNLKKESGLLLQTMYIGIRVWNKRRFIKNNEKNTRVPIMNPKESWHTMSMKELAIIDDETWSRAQKRIRATHEASHSIREGIDKSQGKKRAGHLLSGLLKCPECKSNLIVSGRNHYACGTAINKGTCTNKEYIKRTDIEESIIEAIISIINTDEILNSFKTETLKIAKDIENKVSPQVDYDHEIESRNLQIENLIDAIANGTAVERLNRKIEQLENEIKDIQTKMISEERHQKQKIEFDELIYKEELESAILKLNQYKEHLPIAQKLMASLIGKNGIILDKKKASEIEASLEVDPTILLENQSCQEIVVAGAGFEPTTFGL
ncbi:recombinase family protein [Thiomicrorhabdus hydrogeniphila]